MAIDNWMPPIVTAVKDAVVGFPVYEYLADQIFDIPAVLFEPPSAQGKWPRGPGPFQDWTWLVNIHCLFARAADDIAVADQQAREWLEPIRAALAPLARPGWPTGPTAAPAALKTSEVRAAGFERAGPRTIEWGGVVYHSLTIVWRVEERYFDPNVAA